MTATGWADWGTPRAPRNDPKVTGTDQARYCARCDTKTVWTLGGNPDAPTLAACACGMTAATLLNLDELDNVRRHYRLTTSELDDMVGLPIPMRQ